jgi:mTERF domain-containing protein
MLLMRSKDMLECRSQFLISEVGLEPVCIAHRPVIICLILEGRLQPRHYVLKFLKETGILDRDWSFYTPVVKTDNVFMEKYISLYKEAAPHLAEDYAAACRGEVPANFRFA